jgi:hypothetical protein
MSKMLNFALGFGWFSVLSGVILFNNVMESATVIMAELHATIQNLSGILGSLVRVQSIQ